MKKCEAPDHERSDYANGRSQCNDCQRASVRRYEEKDPDFYKKKYARAKMKPGFKERVAASQRRTKYGAGDTPTGPCQICNERLAASVDHNHDTGHIRGFLCQYCNMRMAVMDDPEWIIKAEEYIGGDSHAHV